MNNSLLAKPDWRDAPEWAQWLAQDHSGYWAWFECKPAAGREVWIRPRRDRGTWEPGRWAPAYTPSMAWNDHEYPEPNPSWRLALECREMGARRARAARLLHDDLTRDIRKEERRDRKGAYLWAIIALWGLALGGMLTVWLLAR